MDAEAGPGRLFATVAAGDRTALHSAHEWQSVRLFVVAFDILSKGRSGNRGYLLAAGTLHSVAGAATATGPVTGLPTAEAIDIAAMR